MTVKVSVPDYSKVVAKATERAADVVTARLQERAVITAPVDTGDYRRNIVADFNNNEVRAEAAHSQHVEYGTSPHVIRAKNGKALKFSSGGSTIFAKSVNHPGTKPQPIMRNAARALQKEVGKIYAAELRKTGV